MIGKGTLSYQSRALMVIFLSAAAGDAAAEQEHPFILWTKQEAAATRRKVEQDPLLAAEKMPGKVLVATPDGKLHEAGDPNDWPRRANLPREVDRITAAFNRPHGYEYGTAMFYPDDARREGSYVTQPGGQPMGFTFRTEAEFPELVAKWRESPPPTEATDQERSIYGAAFMPHLEPPER